MPKSKKYIITEQKITRYIKEGRGSGRKEDYKPWINIQNISSKGRSNRIKGFTSNRIHHFLSDLEAKCFYKLEWDDRVVDIREQYPLLDREMAMNIARDKNINYPIDIDSKTPIVLTTDFLITKIENGRLVDEAITVKYKKDLENKRVIEKFEIEKEYWKKKGISWSIVTEDQINQVEIDNIVWMNKLYNLNDLINECENIDKKKVDELLKILINEIYNESNKDKRLLSLTDKLDYENNTKPGTVLNLFKYLTINKIIDIDIKKDLIRNPVIKDILEV